VGIARSVGVFNEREDRARGWRTAEASERSRGGSCAKVKSPWPTGVCWPTDNRRYNDNLAS